MKQIKKEDISQEVFDLYDAYAHNQLSRREFVSKLSRYAIGGLALPSLLGFLLPNYVDAQEVAKDDKRITSDIISYNSAKGGGEMKGLLTQPTNPLGKRPGVIVVHENRGVNPYIEDVARRVATEGFIGLAPDALAPLGGYPGNDDEGRTLQRQRDRGKMLEDFIAGFDYLKNHEQCNGKIGVVGFCFGGWISNMMAARIPTLGAAVPFYGSPAPAEEVPNINASLMIQFAGLDKRVNARWPDYEKALKKHNKKYVAYTYENVNHGFHNYSTPRYDKDAAQLAWSRTIAFFKEELS